MSIQERRERERARRHQLIIEAARDLAEAEGWEVVTTRRLADRVEYSQPVLYSHFDGKASIVAAVAIEGFRELAGELRRARMAALSPQEALGALADTYLDFAAARPAVYEAMFVRRIDVAYGQGDDTPAPLREAFGEFLMVLEPLADGRDPELLAEVAWAALHGLASLTHGERLRPAFHQQRIDLLIGQLVPGMTS